MLDNYEPVAARLDRWLQAHLVPSSEVFPRVITHMISEPGADICVIRAELWLSEMLIATGYAEEIRGQGNVNRTSHVENCETSAIGRALANAGMAGSDMAKRPSREEMAKVERSSARAEGGVVRQFTGTKTITNKMKGTCVNCRGQVEVGEGIATNDGSGWKTMHANGACPTEEAF